jgi:hypothetical protein
MLALLLCFGNPLITVDATLLSSFGQSANDPYPWWDTVAQ